MLIVVPLSHLICRLQGLFIAPVFPRRYCRLMRGMRHFSPAEVSSSPSADSFFKVQSAFLTKQKSRHIWKSCQLLCHGGPYPPIGSVHFIPYISTLGPKSGFWAFSPCCQNRRKAGDRRLRMRSCGGRCVGGNAPFFSLFSFVGLPTPIG